MSPLPFIKQRPRAVVEVRPVDWRDEWEAAWFRERLQDPTLIDAGVVVVVDGIGFLAVPVGGRRRGGYTSLDNPEAVYCVRDALVGRRGFPRVRVHWSSCPSTCHVVEWGEDAPDASQEDDVTGRFYGYSEQAIQTFLKGFAHRDR